jgi:hypothetical protein
MGGNKRSELLEEALKFNLQIVTKTPGQETQLKNDLKSLMLPTLRQFESLGQPTDILVEESHWTWIDKNGQAVSLEREDQRCSCCHLYTGCFQFFSGGWPIWSSQFVVDDRRKIQAFHSYFYNLIDPDVVKVNSGTVFVSYSGERQKLAHQIRIYLSKLGVSVYDYHLDPIDTNSQDELIRQLKRKLDHADVVILIDDFNYQSGIYTHIEASHVIGADEGWKKLIPVRISDQHEAHGIIKGGYDLYNWNHHIIICVCHWPEKIRELGAWVVYILKNHNESSLIRRVYSLPT